jgi:hypothetical protein
VIAFCLVAISERIAVMKQHGTERIIVILLTAVVALYAQPLMADPMAETFNVSYDATFREIDYSLIGGDDGQTYEVTALGSGCIEVTEAAPDLTGPTDNADVSISCKSPSGTGSVTLKFYKGPVANNILLFTVTLVFKCDKDCNIIEIKGTGPTLSSWGIVVLLMLLLASGVWIVRGRTRKAKLA